MRRLMVLGIVVLLTIAGLAAVVRADAPRTPAAGGGDAVAPARLEMPELQTVPRVPAFTCNPNGPVEKYLNCLNKYLDKLASNLNTTIAKLQQTQSELSGLYDCFLAVPVTSYMGYLYGDPNAPFQTSALDFTEDPSTQVFDYFALIDPNCVTP
jgi:hypothetical protein